MKAEKIFDPKIQKRSERHKFDPKIQKRSESHKFDTKTQKRSERHKYDPKIVDFIRKGLMITVETVALNSKVHH